MHDEDTLYERCLIQIISEEVEKLGLKHREFASRVWPELSRGAAGTKWSTIRNSVTRTGHPQGLHVRDARKMSNILGIEYAYLSVMTDLRLQARIKNGDIEEG